jgi:hypothetical protein
MLRGALGVFLVIAAMAPPRASIAAPGEATQPDAQALFEQGKDAMSVGRFAEAERLFQRSLELVPKASAAFNLAVARRGMGKPKEAHDTLLDLLAGRFGPLPDDRRAQTEELARETERDVATLIVAMKGAPVAEVRMDGARVGDVAEGRELRTTVNPGEHLVTLSAKLRDTAERAIAVGPGRTGRVAAALTLSREARRATLVLVAELPSDEVEIVGAGRGRGTLERKLDPGPYTVRVISASGERTSTVELLPATSHRVVLESPRASLIASPWFWTAAAVVAGGAVASYFLLRDHERDPVGDPVFGVTETLRSR